MNRAPLLLVLATLSTLATLAALPARAQGVPAPAGVLNLTTSASIEVPQDVLNVVFGATREGADAQAVQAALKQALDAALTEARRLAKPGQVDVRTGNFALHPRYANPPQPPRSGQPPTPVISGWQGSAELTVSGRDTAAIAQLSGRVTTMTISRVAYTLSREAREKAEAEAVAQAIERWRTKAAQTSQQFGYTGYTVREVNLATHEPGPDRPVPMMRMQARAADAGEALPTEAGKGEVTATVTGSAQMTK